jgi:stage III sporulation protein AH
VKTFKRNAVIITVLLFVCVAAYLNWSYNKNAAKPSTDAGAKIDTSEVAQPKDDGAGLFYTPEKETVNTEFFSAARLNRQQARDAAAATLATVSRAENASEEMIEAALAEISKLASDSVKEAELEGLIKAKGFADCVVYLSSDGVSVTVPAPEDGLTTAEVAKITDIVVSHTDWKAIDLNIIEVRSSI